jgi:hypothetical protein
MKYFVLFLLIFVSSENIFATTSAGVDIVTYQPLGFRVDNTDQGQRVRRLFDKIKSLGIDTLIFNFRGYMVTGISSDIASMIPQDSQHTEEELITQTVQYARTLGFHVAFRPILLVIGPHGEFPYTDETGMTWWHGVIRPEKPDEWFANYFLFHQRYLQLAAKLQVDWYSVGAEMHSMTSGLGSRTPDWKFGFPDKWVELINKAREILGAKTQITYGINYTDQYVLEDNNRTWGGEFEQWHAFMTKTPQDDLEAKHQQAMRSLWQALDFISIDFYRSLGSNSETYPDTFDELVNRLVQSQSMYSSALDQVMAEMNQVSQSNKLLCAQEIGYRSAEKSFVFPYAYEGDGAKINLLHQAAAWQAFLQVFLASEKTGFLGFGTWQVLLDNDSDLDGNNDGFTPLGKPMTEKVFQSFLIKSYQ